MGVRVRINVMMRQDILDPQGQAIEEALNGLGFEGVGEVRQGKTIELTLPLEKGKEAEASVRAMCDKLLVNRVIETYKFDFLP